MAGLNKVMAIGRLGRDQETFYTSNNLTITKFSIAASEMDRIQGVKKYGK